MSNNYKRGAEKERRILERARKEGIPDAHVFRSAGSHSAVDVVIIDAKNRKVYFIQSKLPCMTLKDGSWNAEARRYFEEMKDVAGQFEVIFKVIDGGCNEWN